MKSKSHRSQPAHTPTFAFSAFPSPTAGIWNTFHRFPSSSTFFFFLHFSSSSPFTQTSFQSLLPSHSALSIFVRSALCLCKDKCKQIFCGKKQHFHLKWLHAFFLMTCFLACSIISLPLIADLTSGVLHSDITKWLLVWFAVNRWAIILTLCLNALIFQISGM